MGTDVVSMCVKALKGTWLPLAKTADDGAGPDPNAALEALLAPDGIAVEPPAAPAATDALEGPNPAVVVDPPDTTPPPPPEEGAPERMKRSRKSVGSFWNPAATSSTT